MDSKDVITSKLPTEREGRTLGMQDVTLVSPAVGLARFLPLFSIDVSSQHRQDSQEEATECYNMAHKFLLECKAASNISELNTAIFLLYCAARSLFSTGPQLQECIGHLVTALLARFSYTVDMNDVQMAFLLQYKTLANVLDEDDLVNTESDRSKVEDPEEAMSLAASLLYDFHQAKDWTTLENTIFLYGKALALWLTSHHWRWHWELSEALQMQFHITGDLAQLDEAICHLRRVQPLQPNRSYYLLAALTMRNQRETVLESLVETVAIYENAQRSDREATELFDSSEIPFQVLQQSSDTVIDSVATKLQTARWKMSWGHPSLLFVLIELTNVCYLRFEKTGNMVDLDIQIGALQELLSLQPPSHPDRSGYLNNLAQALLNRFKQQGDARDIEESIALHREVLALKAPHPEQSISLNNLGLAVAARFEQCCDLKDIDEAIALHREALALQAPPYPDPSFSLNNLATAVLTRFEQQGDPKDIDEAIVHYREALMLRAPLHPKRINTLHNLASAFLTRFDQQGDLEDVDNSIALEKEALELLVPSHPSRSDYLATLARAVSRRFEIKGDPSDIDESMALYREALTLQAPAHPQQSTSLNNLAIAFLGRFEQRGDPKDIDESIALHRKSLALQAATKLGRSKCLNNLGQAVATRCKQQGDPMDIEESIALFKEALALQAPSDPNRSECLTNIAGAFMIRFDQQGDPKDIDECIALYREVLILQASPHPHQSHALSNLAFALSVRFDQRGDSGDIDEAITLLEEALELRPLPHPHRSMSLNHFAQAVLARFNVQGNPHDIDRSIALHREAVTLQALSHPDQSMFLNNLARALSARFQQQGDPKDIDDSIALYREALTLVPPLHPGRSKSMSNLAAVVTVRFRLQQDPKDIDEALALYNEALSLEAPPHPHRVDSLMNLGSALVMVHRYQPNEDILNDAISAFEEASTYSSSSPLTRFNDSYAWATIATQYSHSSSMDAFHKTIILLPQLAAFHLNLNSRQRILMRSKVASLASDAAACAVNLNAYNVAVEFLEASRSIFWAQAMHLRTPLDDLRAINPTLARRLEELSRRLEVASFRDTSLDGYLSTQTQRTAISKEAEGMQCRQLSQEWEQVVNSVRILPGFEDFLKPRNIAKLQQAAACGPIVILTANNLTTSALVVTPFDDVQCVHFPEISLPRVKLYAEMFRAVSTASTVDINAFVEKRALEEDPGNWSMLEARLLCQREGEVNVSSDVVFRVLLELLWEEIVKPLFDSLNLEKSTYPSRLWWCPIGPFAFLPIHAAGIYNTDYTDSVSDYVVSSYTPTLSALLDPPTHNVPLFKITAVIEPNAPNCSRLPGTEVELAKIRNRVPAAWLTALPGTTGASVIHHLQDSSMVHFACHGVQDLKNPLDSALMLSDGCLKVSKIMRGPEDVGTYQIKNSMSLVFLSACETAKGDDSTPDEAMHLAATVLFAGFRGVVATMWSIDDRDGPKVADTFYEHLFKGCNATSNPPLLPDLKQAAEALHVAVGKLKKEPGITFKRWVPFVHYGL